MWSAFLTGFVAGIATTPHCLGMCGGFPLHLSKSSGRGRLIPRQFLFVAGKAFTYVFLGALAASLGAIVFRNTSFSSYAPALRYAAGGITIVFGLAMLGFRLPSIGSLQGISDAGIVRSLFGGLFASPSPLAAFVLGLGVGFLPCPLPMGMLAVAAASHDLPTGMALMAGVGAGTAPGLLAVGLFGFGLNRGFARHGMRIAGVIVLVVGLLTVGRASGLLAHKGSGSHSAPVCCGGAER